MQPMKKEVLKIKGVSKPNSPFSQVVKAGGLLFVTSQLSCELKTGMIMGAPSKNRLREL